MKITTFDSNKKYTEVKPWLVTPHPDAEVVDVPGAFYVSDCRWMDDEGNQVKEEGAWSLYRLPDGRWVDYKAEGIPFSAVMHRWSAFDHLPEQVEVGKEHHMGSGRYQKFSQPKDPAYHSPRKRFVSVTPSGHPRCLVHFPATVPEEEQWGKVVEVRAKARNENYRTDNGPAFNRGQVQIQLPEGLTYCSYAVGMHYEWGIFSGERLAGEVLDVKGEIPKAPIPGLAYPGADFHNPARVGGGYCPAHGEWADVTVRWLKYWPVLSAIWATRLA